MQLQIGISRIHRQGPATNNGCESVESIFIVTSALMHFCPLPKEGNNSYRTHGEKWVDLHSSLASSTFPMVWFWAIVSSSGTAHEIPEKKLKETVHYNMKLG